MNQAEFSADELNQLYRYACSLLGKQQDAFDLLHNALEKYIKSSSPAGRSKPMAYMRSIMRNHHIDQLRHDALIQWDDYDEQQTVSVDLNWNTLEQNRIAEDEAEQLLKQMTGIEREMMFLWAVEGYSTAEVAVHLGMPKNTVLSRIHRLRQKLKDSSRQAQGGTP